jgi:Fe/S biogenesis protein NfuA
MIDITEPAQAYFRHLLASQGGDAVGIRVSAVNPGTPRADARLEFCESGDLLGDEWQLECEGFVLYVDAPSVRWLDGARMDYEAQATGGQLTIKAPHIKGQVPGADASLVDRVQYVLETEVNPMLAAHKGRVALEEVTADGVVVLRFGGGCHGCGMVDLTLRNGIEKTLRERVPDVTAVRDATDHASGAAPYVAR